ncbi:MAG: TetR/AcrR family transcriptional regulator [Hyphomonas sp.]|uniref:TetR/AcrR family transcriptional regulator n=1 Tax=Hyphomonas sp. TaxID=87 RepID=UPI00185D6B6C|nr:TetR/AcrR family transcriptional regulator [Hyphomonas sp.]MBU3920804.1 TetR/AcrR family transcriptional regulator [Alphaproteobacteria bacterium]MBA3068248.1 TetR/AcrR family transcriptional regulator [Hyphomonas sp.]MBU4060886.1 TetR/AcrR family transcriptional regulator [Alphaproteobacteria bacterium]MBU4164870.1 TetR/AcrR family transcriptional regulator [Alphaproteobacteria bacterium]MBU4568095.1 TetR/AcrR family transcriptional regulator [Alphaproteobacteria bacterium]
MTESGAHLTRPERRLTQAERRDRSERELIAAAIKVVAGQGVSSATFDAIAREAGFSRGLVTQRFGSKQGLIRTLITHLHEWQGEVLEAGQVAQMDGLTALIAFIHLHTDHLRDVREGDAYFMLLSAAIADRLETRADFADSHEVERELIRSIIERGRASGHIRPEIDADAEALLTGCSLLGLRMQSLIDPDFDPVPVRDALIAALRSHLAPKP